MLLRNDVVVSVGYNISFSLLEKELLLLCDDGSERATWLKSFFRSDQVLFMQDGELSKKMLFEVVKCFLGGNDIAVVMLSFSLIERSLHGRFLVNKQIIADDKLLVAAVKNGWVSDDDSGLITELKREIRNPVVHFREESHQTRQESRANKFSKSLNDILEDDARKSIEILIKVLSKAAI
jgi:hypothetical protein